MSAKRRETNKHLPQRVYHKHGAYYYVDRNNKWHFLGKTFIAMGAAWVKLRTEIIKNNNFVGMEGATIEELENKNMRYMWQLFDRYMLEVAPGKSENTYKGNISQMQPLRQFFGKMRIEDVDPVAVYKYLDKRKIMAPVGANREKALLSHVFAMAIRWGAVKDNPCRNVKRLPEKPKEIYVEDKVYYAVYKIADEFMQCYMDFLYLSCQRVSDPRKILLPKDENDLIKMQQAKTGKKLEFEWREKFRACVDRIRRLPRKISSVYLFCKRNGQPYTYWGIASKWRRLMDRAIEDKVITEEERFALMDLRPKGLTDLAIKDNLDVASDTAGHSNRGFTERVYLRKHKLVKPGG